MGLRYGPCWAALEQSPVLSGGHMSLRKVTNGHLESSGFWVFKTWRFYITKTEYFELSDHEFKNAERRLQLSGACMIGRNKSRVLWWTTDGLFWADPNLSDEDVELLVWDRQRRQESRLDRLRKVRMHEHALTEKRRTRIPEDVRASVWNRDNGRCVQCRSEEDLQFDHIIPVAKGGGNSIENIQILCGTCNREKSDSIV